MKFNVEEREKRKGKGKGSQQQTIIENTTRVAPLGRGCREASNVAVEVIVFPSNCGSRAA